MVPGYRLRSLHLDKDNENKNKEGNRQRVWGEEKKRCRLEQQLADKENHKNHITYPYVRVLARVFEVSTPASSPPDLTLYTDRCAPEEHGK
ncbi:hypothetical protein PROFUN_08715 [Planoprotostelium fungivorum]|uniref:Uncharacterized protein n=1 Tax=Planoprotostelium fungivorum TaxID=1890364 RepID=A0A2P6MQV6_9EUKA|nr:hypothetical protein PROFUN_08715 [Planoprotostelium fungivorum]